MMRTICLKSADANVFLNSRDAKRVTKKHEGDYHNDTRRDHYRRIAYLYFQILCQREGYFNARNFVEVFFTLSKES